MDYSSDVLSFQRKDGKIVMKQDSHGDINILDEKLKKQMRDHNEGNSGEQSSSKEDESNNPAK